jgi:YbgC/YbaW family acyl-CoA thioester hydrolase
VSDGVFLFEVQIHNENTDFSGFVHHPDYLCFFEQARAHALGTRELARLWREEGVGFVMHKATLVYKEGAVFGDVLEIRSTGRIESEYRVTFAQKAHRKADGKLLVEGTFEMVCIDGGRRLVPIPASARELAARGPTG